MAYIFGSYLGNTYYRRIVILGIVNFLTTSPMWSNSEKLFLELKEVFILKDVFIQLIFQIVLYFSKVINS